MKRLRIAPAVSPLIVIGPWLWTSQTAPLGSIPPIEKIGCARSGDKCPYGYRIERHGGHGWSCEPCWPQKHSYLGDRDYEPKRYRDYDDQGYEPRITEITAIRATIRGGTATTAYMTLF